jgi:hypothetical protein
MSFGFRGSTLSATADRVCQFQILVLQMSDNQRDIYKRVVGFAREAHSQNSALDIKLQNNKMI